jgi:hypothetical protein
MLKAVRFDEEKHKDILEYIAQYRDNKNRPNESEAIRFLMQKGYEALNNYDQVVHANVVQQPIAQEPKFDLESMKKEIYAEVMAQVSSQALGSISTLIDKLGDLKPVYVSPEQTFTQVNTTSSPELTKINSPEPKQKTTKQIEIPKDTNPLLANLLGNANR